jgi:hypothetical protein
LTISPFGQTCQAASGTEKPRIILRVICHYRGNKIEIVFIVITLAGIIGYISVKVIFYTLKKNSDELYVEGRIAEEVFSISEIHEFLHKLYFDKTKDCLFCIDYESHLEIRIRKKLYKSQVASLELEYRFNDKTRKLYDSINNIIQNDKLEFRTVYTPQKKLPKRLVKNYKNSGAGAVDLIAKNIAIILNHVNSTTKLKIYLGYKEPSFWVRKPNNDI